MVEALLIASGILGMGLGLRGVAARSRQARLPRAPGQLVSREVRSTDHPGSRGVGRFEARPSFTFTVDGEERTGNRLTPNPVLMSEVGAWTVVQDLPERLNVYYDPQDPGVAFLAPDPAPLSWLALLAGVVLTGVGLGRLFL